MLSQQSDGDAPVNCDTIQRLVKARWKPNVSKQVFIKRESAGEGGDAAAKRAYCTVVKSSEAARGKAAFSHPSMKLNVGERNEACVPITVKAITWTSEI